jgi:hypothetical protein
MDELDDVLEKLNALAVRVRAIRETLEEVEAKVGEIKGLEARMDFAIRARRFTTHDEALVWKNIEDGIIRKIDTASPEQMQMLLDKKGFAFRYYPEIYDGVDKVGMLTIKEKQYGINMK